MDRMRVRTDLALEARESFDGSDTEVHGVVVEEEYEEETKKGIGHYIGAIFGERIYLGLIMGMFFGIVAAHNRTDCRSGQSIMNTLYRCQCHAKG